MTVVTGGAGFIGSRLVAALNERGEDDVVIVDRLGTGSKWRNLRGLRFAELVDVDVFRERVRTGGIPAGSTVFHLGAPGTETRDADRLVDGIYRYSKELAEACLKSGARMLHASSAATYGHGEFGFFDNENTTERLRPETPYAFAKHLFDLWSLESGFLETNVTLKLFTVYGPGEAHKGPLCSHVRRLLREIRLEGRATLPRSAQPDCQDGAQARDFVHVDDVVSMFLHFYQHPERHGLYNCGTGRARTFTELAKLLFDAMERDPAIEYASLPDDRRSSFQHFTQADMSRAEAAGIEVHQFRSLEAGIAALLNLPATGPFA